MEPDYEKQQRYFEQAEKRIQEAIRVAKAERQPPVELCNALDNYALILFRRYCLLAGRVRKADGKKQRQRSRREREREGERNRELANVCVSLLPSSFRSSHSFI